MGSGDWFKNVISLKKVKRDRSKKSKGSSAAEKSHGFKEEHHSKKESTIANGASNKNPGLVGVALEEAAATRIQTAFRAYMARKALRRLKGIVRFKVLTNCHSVVKQASTTLSYLHSWSRIQAQIRARRICMVTEGQIRQKKLENQLKLEAKLHELEVEWNCSSETMDEILARIHQREAAAVKRERTLAYAFGHQWRANSSPNLGPGSHELGKADWGWSWMDRWIAARPWEGRIPVQSSPKKVHRQQASKNNKKESPPKAKASNSMKSNLPNGKGTIKARKLSFDKTDKPTAPKESIRAEEESSGKTEQPASRVK